MFGPHLTLDIYGCNKEKLMDVELVTNILEELPEQLGLHKISKPNVVVYEGNPNSFDKGGISSFIMFAESHLSIHTFQEQKHAFIDMFSCKMFDVDAVTKYFVDVFGAEKAEKNLIFRGKHFPRDIEKAAPIVIKQRKKATLTA